MTQDDIDAALDGAKVVSVEHKFSTDTVRVVIEATPDIPRRLLCFDRFFDHRHLPDGRMELTFRR